MQESDPRKISIRPLQTPYAHCLSLVNPATGAKVFRYLQESSPNITWLGLIVPKAWETTKTVSAKPLHQLLVDPTFNFPHLTHLSIIDAGMNYIGYEAFFLRHSNIKVLSYWGIPLNSSGLSNPEMLPTLSQLVATVDDCISLCSSGMRPIDSLLLSVAVDITPETAILLKEAFMCTKSMRQLAIFDLRGDGINLDNLRIITAACPQLTHFDLPLNAEASKVSVSTVFHPFCKVHTELLIGLANCLQHDSVEPPRAETSQIIRPCRFTPWDQFCGFPQK